METAVLIDTSLGTHLMVFISPDSATISDIKRKILNEHLLLFPNIGEIKINALKVNRYGYFYHLLDYMLVKTAFASVGVGIDWCLSVDASVAEEHTEDHKAIEPYISNSSDLVPVDTGRRNEALLLQDGDDHHVKQISASQQFGSSDSIKENSEDLHKEAEHSANSNSQVPFPANNTVSRSNGDVGDDKICEDLLASVATPVSKKKLKSKKRKKDVIHHVLKEKVAIVVEGEKDASDSSNVLKENLFQNGPSLVLSEVDLGNQIPVDKTSHRKKRSAVRKRMVDEGMEVPGQHHELETNGHKYVPCNDHENKSKENSLQSGPAAKKKHKVEKKDDNENSLMEKVDQGTGLDTIGQKPESTTAVVDHSNTEFENQNQLLAANVSVGKKKRKRRQSKVSEVSSSKDVDEDTFQAIHAFKDKDLGSMVDPDSSVVKRFTSGEISEPCLIPPMNIQEVSERNRVLHPRGDDDMDVANDGNMESKNEAPELAVASVTNRRDSCDQNSFHVDGHPTQESINFRKAFGVSAHENQSDNLEVVEENVEQNKSSKKVKMSKKKSKGLVGGTEAVNAVRNSISPAEHPTCASDDVEQGGTADGKVEIKMKKLDCLLSVTDVRADDVIQDVLESLKQCNNGPENGENMEKESKKETRKKKKSSTFVAPSELQGKDDVDHRGPTVLVHNVSASSKSTWKTVKGNSSSAVQLNMSDFESDKKTPKSQHDGRPVQDVVGVDQPKSTCVDNGNNSKEFPDGSETLKSQQKHENVDSGEIIFDKVRGKTEVETAAKGKKKNSKPELSPSDMLNGNKRNEAKAQPVKSSSIQSQRSSLKFEPSKPLLTISGNAVKGPLQSNGSANTDSTPKTAQRPKSTCEDNGNNSKESPDGSETLKGQQKHENVDSGEIIFDKVGGKTEVETAAKGKKKNSKPEFSSSDMLNGNKRKEAKAQPVKSSSIQSPRSSLKFEPSKPLLTVSESAVKGPLQSNGSDNIDSTPKTAQRPIAINSSRARAYLKKNKTGGVSSSALETPKNAINLKKGGNEPQSHLDFAKTPGSDSRKVANSSANKKSLLATMGTIFGPDDEESSEDEDGVGDSDSSTRTPSDSPSFGYSGNSHENGSCNSEGEATSGRKKQKQGSSSSKNISLHAILVNSSSFKKAKLSASQGIDSQPEEFVPDSQPK